MIFKEPVLIFGGPYSNLEATQAVLAEASRRGIRSDHVICTGDVVAYGADAKSCVDLVRKSGIHVVMGNCEEQIAAEAADCGCGFTPGGACDRASRIWFSYACRRLGQQDRDWMAALPRRLDFELNGLRLTALHGSLNDISRFIFASTSQRVKALDLLHAGSDGIVAGHCGLPFTQVIDGKLWHNPGVVGAPANDGTPRVWFSVLRPNAEARSIEIEHATLSYDHAAAAAKMRAAGLPADYATALGAGVWPNCDVLPPSELKASGRQLVPGRLTWRRDSDNASRSWPQVVADPPLDPGKFQSRTKTAKGERRAEVALSELRTLWINTGTLCNLACQHCYIESTPRNDRLAYISAAEVATYLDEIERDGLHTERIGFTGGEPFMNPEFPEMLDDVLSRGLRALVLTNAMKPMMRRARRLDELRARFGDRLTLRVSIDHYTPELHELERGPRTWRPTIDGLNWLVKQGFTVHVAGRMYSGEAEGIVRAGYARLFSACDIPIDAMDPLALVLFPEMDARVDVPEITEQCWSLLHKSPLDVMCSSSRMVVKRKGAAHPAVLACTLIAYDPQFELGATLAEASGPVALNHPHCAKFCVLGGAACSAG